MMDFTVTSPLSSEVNLAMLVSREAGAITVTGNGILRLGEVDGAWIVNQGKIDLVAARGNGSIPAYRRTLATFGPGELIFSSHLSPNAGSGQMELLAIPQSGTQLIGLNKESFCRLGLQYTQSDLIEHAISTWTSRLHAVLPWVPVPSSRILAIPGAHVQLTAENPAALMAENLLWIRQLTGISLLFGDDKLSIREAGKPVPVCAGAWLTGAELATLTASTTTQAMQEGWLWEGISGLHELVIHYAMNEMPPREAERFRLDIKFELDQSVFAKAQAQLAAVLNNEHDGKNFLPAFSEEESSAEVETSAGNRLSEPRMATFDRALHESKDPLPTGAVHAESSAAPDPLFAACSLIAKRLGVTLRAPKESPGTFTALQQLQQLCDASHLYSRKVLLRGDWWRHDHGPLLAYFRTDTSSRENNEDRPHPVALLPSSGRSYQIIDPIAQTTATVDARRAKNIETEAFMLYHAGIKPILKPRELLGPVLRQHKHELFIISLVVLAGGLLAALVPVIVGVIYSRVIPNNYRSELIQLVLVLVAVAAGACAFQITRALSVLRLTAKLDLHLQAFVWGRLFALPVSFFRRYRVGDLTNRVEGIGTIRQILLADVTSTILAVVISLVSFFLLFYYSWQLALLATALLLGLGSATFVLSRWQLKHRRDSLEIQGRVSSLAFALVQGISKLRSSGAETRSYEVWARHFAAQTRHRFEEQRAVALQTSLNAFYLVASELLLFACMGFGLRHHLGISSFLAFGVAFGQVQSALLTFVSLIPELLAIVPIYERLQPIFTEPPEADESRMAAELHGEVRVCNVSYRYHETGPLVLENICFHARPGEFIAIVGPSGSGKSTLVRLLLGFDRPSLGSINYDEVDLTSLDVKSVRRQIGVVLQNSKPITGDIFTNIVGGTSNNMQDAWEAARIAGIDQDIKAMPMGMHTLIGEGATTFSGGERQRLMIARAVVNRPRIVLLDEATSALDNPTQAKVQQCLNELNATRIVVAHRLSTVRHAARIYVLHSGRIVEEGTYEELWNLGGYFSEMARRQTKN
jgi:NHLM bacteriocin system ABC transporter ATP-binding protein